MLAITTATMAARIEAPNSASPTMTCPNSIRKRPTSSATGTAATRSTASSAAAMTAFVDQLIVLIVRAVYPTAISLTPHQVLLLKICRVDVGRKHDQTPTGLGVAEE